MSFEVFTEKAPELRCLGIKVSVDGNVLLNKRFDGECRRNIYSATKSFTSCAVGFAVQEGLLKLEERLVDAFKNDLPSKLEGHIEECTVRDLLTMRLGQPCSFLMGVDRPFYKEDDWVRLALSRPFTDAPGDNFVYNNVGPYLAGVLVQRRSGCDLVNYLTPRLFTHISIKRPTWESDPLGYSFGAGGLFLTLSEFDNFGKFYLDDGCVNGRRLLSHSWISESTGEGTDSNYAYLFWRDSYGNYYASGKYFQRTIIIPNKKALVTITAENRDDKALTALLYGEIIDAL